jgi:hypothetical protein
MVPKCHSHRPGREVRSRVLVVRTSRQPGLRGGASEHSAVDHDRTQRFVRIARELVAAASIGAAAVFVSMALDALAWLTLADWAWNH